MKKGLRFGRPIKIHSRFRPEKPAGSVMIMKQSPRGGILPQRRLDPAGRPAQPWVIEQQNPNSDTVLRAAGKEHLPRTAWSQQYGSAGSDRFPYTQGRIWRNGSGSERPQQMVRRQISGNFEINCMTCHNGDQTGFKHGGSPNDPAKLSLGCNGLSGLAVVNGTLQLCRISLIGI